MQRCGLPLSKPPRSHLISRYKQVTMCPTANTARPRPNDRLVLLGTTGGPRPSLTGQPGQSDPIRRRRVSHRRPLRRDPAASASGVQPHELGAIFITHHHSDHSHQITLPTLSATRSQARWSTTTPTIWAELNSECERQTNRDTTEGPPCQPVPSVPTRQIERR